MSLKSFLIHCSHCISYTLLMSLWIKLLSSHPRCLCWQVLKCFSLMTIKSQRCRTHWVTSETCFKLVQISLSTCHSSRSKRLSSWCKKLVSRTNLRLCKLQTRRRQIWTGTSCQDRRWRWLEIIAIAGLQDSCCICKLQVRAKVCFCNFFLSSQNSNLKLKKMMNLRGFKSWSKM